MSAVMTIETPQSEATALIQAIERAAVNPAVDVEKMERLFALQERMMTRNAEAAFNAAMSVCQSEIGPIAADAENKQTHSVYATYAALDKKLRPVYTKHGFSISYDTADSPKPEHVRVLAYVAHADGFKRTYQVDMPADGKGAKGGDVMTKTHASGAANSYGMRYLLKLIWNVAIGEDDNDGNEEVEYITDRQTADLQAMAEEVGANREGFLKYFGIERLADLPASRFKDAIAALNKKRKQS